MAYERKSAERRLLCLACVATALVYWRTITFDFVYDDQALILLNGGLLESWRDIPSYFLRNQPKDAILPASFYRPLMILWMFFNRQVFGFVPAWWHLTAVAMHVLAVYLVYRVGQKLIGDGTSAAIGALLFAVHPIHIEPVAWITSNACEVLFTIFLLSSFLAYVRGSRAWYGAALFLYACALLVKETAAIYPGLLLAYEVLWVAPAPGSWRARAWLWSRRLSSFVALTFAYLLLRAHVLGPAGTRGKALLTVLPGWPEALSFYLRQLVWPFNLAFYYDGAFQGPFNLRSVLAPTLVLMVLSAAFVLWFRSSRRMWFAACAILLPLLPVLLGLTVFQPDDPVHDRYLYFSSVAFSLLFGFALTRIPSRKLLAVLVFLLTIGLGISANLQSRQWETDLTLFSRAVQRAPRNPLAAYDYGAALQSRGDLKGAAIQFERRLQLLPDDWHSLYALGMLAHEQHDYPQAEAYLSRVVEQAPADATVETRAGQCYYLGKVRLALREPQQAEFPLREAVRLTPDVAGYHAMLGEALRAQGKLQEAQSEFAAEQTVRSHYLKRVK